MNTIYLVILIAIMGLAVWDIVVGVTNDASNFLNSSVGSKVAPMWVILTVASVGIIIGSFFSHGMMEIARNGVFHPAQFTFPDIMMLFLAVMITDVILLDIFNTLGLPTSITVSLIFELLGAAVAVALVNIWRNDSGRLIEYLNAGKAMTIISGILLSIVIAFICGSIVMYISRVIFSFNYKKSFAYVGSLWGGIALTAMSYFIVFKGLAGSALLPAERLDFLNQHLFLVLLVIWIGWTIIMAVCQHLFKWNILRFIVLMGTGALALSYAGNDLVNFVGVFMASLNSYEIASEAVSNGISINNLYMSGLADPVNANSLFLLAAGAIMILALWFSKKTKTVTQTEINLANQSTGAERFSSTQASRSLVRSALSINRWVDRVTPQGVKDFIDKRFEPLPKDDIKDKPSFDLIRASVNLTVSALLISIATSLTLPLSTTYVTFMVAMGSSLADRAWGRESAVYRITGVLVVIGGWFMTALIAFVVAAAVAFALMYGKIYAIIGLLLLVVFLLIQFSVIHRRREKKKENQNVFIPNDHDIVKESGDEVREIMTSTTRIYEKTIDCLHTEDRKQLKDLAKEADKLYLDFKDRRDYEVVPTLQNLKSSTLDTAQQYVQIIEYSYEISKSLKYIVDAAYEYIDNNHEGFNDEQMADMKLMESEIVKVYSDLIDKTPSQSYKTIDNAIRKYREEITGLNNDITKRQIQRTKSDESGARNSTLFLNILNETRRIAMLCTNLMKSHAYMFNRK